jgi:hypothetical protein
LATPPTIPIVAGTAPLALTTDSNNAASAILSGYGKPAAD